MNPKELAILSLINEAPSHAYTLEEKIEQRGMRQWTDIGFSSIYRIINDLEKKKFVKSKIIQQESSGRTKKQYTITQEGKDELRIAVKDSLAKSSRPKSNFDLALSNIWLLSKEEALFALEEYLRSLRERRDIMFKNWDKSGGKGNIPYLLDALFEHGEVLSTAEIRFIENLISKVKKYGITSAIATKE